jgi:hypothetical protein
MTFFAYSLRLRENAGWGSLLLWVVTSLFLGPGSLLVFWLQRKYAARPDPTALNVEAMRAPLWFTPVMLTGFALIQQYDFLTYSEWRAALLPYYLLPIIGACTVLLIRVMLQPSPKTKLWDWFSIFLSYLFISTIITTCAYYLIEHLSMQFLHFHLPIYHPLKWLVIMVTSIVLFLIAALLQRQLLTWEIMPWEHMYTETGTASHWQPLKNILAPILLVITAYALLFVVHVHHMTSVTPIYITFFDIARALLGLA